MKKRFFRLISLGFMILFAAIMAAGCTPSGKAGSDGFIYHISNIIGYCGDETEITIPLEYNNVPIDEMGIGPKKFLSALHLKKITIQGNIVKLRGFDFNGGVQRDSNDSSGFSYVWNEDGNRVKLQLEEINVTEDNEHFMSIDGVVYGKGNEETVFFPPAKKSYTVPDHIEMIRGDWFRYNNDLVDIYIPSEKIISIGGGTYEKAKNIYVSSLLLTDYISGLPEQYKQYESLFKALPVS